MLSSNYGAAMRPERVVDARHSAEAMGINLVGRCFQHCSGTIDRRSAAMNIASCHCWKLAEHERFQFLRPKVRFAAMAIAPTRAVEHDQVASIENWLPPQLLHEDLDALQFGSLDQKISPRDVKRTCSSARFASYDHPVDPTEVELTQIAQKWFCTHEPKSCGDGLKNGNAS